MTQLNCFIILLIVALEKMTFLFLLIFYRLHDYKQLNLYIVSIFQNFGMTIKDNIAIKMESIHFFINTKNLMILKFPNIY